MLVKLVTRQHGRRLRLVAFAAAIGVDVMVRAMQASLWCNEDIPSSTVHVDDDEAGEVYRCQPSGLAKSMFG